MPPNKYIFERLAGIQGQLIKGFEAGAGLSSASKGSEREHFIDHFLSQVLPKPFRFATGDATDKSGAKSGQLDVVIEFPFGPSLPIVGGATSRLFLAETVAAVIEVKSNVTNQWDEAVHTAQQLHPLARSYGAAMLMGPDLPKIPLFVAGFKGWQRLETVQNKLASAPEISGLLVIDPGIFVSSAQFGGVTATGPWALWGLIACLHQATGFLKAVFTNPLDYAM
jgi:hypothetical protein